RRGLGMHFRGRVHARLSQARGSGGRHSAIQDQSGDGLVQIVRYAQRRRMSATSSYTPWHPRWYRTRVSTWWWLGNWHYLKFILRELSSIAVGLAVTMTLVQIAALRRGPEAYERFQHALRSPLLTVAGFLTLAFVLFHSITWFNLAPHALAVRVGGRRVPALAIALPHYLAWL